MHTPAYWYAQDAKVPFWLKALSPVYLAGRRLHRNMVKPVTPHIYTICVGNVTAGGSGKTPTAIALMDLIQREDMAHNPWFLVRGQQDENMLLKKHAPVAAFANRKQGLDHIFIQKGDLAVMDDGFQNPALRPHLSFLIVDGVHGFGNGLLLPAGPLREPVTEAFTRADAAILIGSDQRNALQDFKKPVFYAEIEAAQNPNQNQNYIGFAGIALPRKFYHTLEKNGYRLLDFKSFPDHYHYRQKDISALLALAKEHDAKLITTEKDFVKLPQHPDIAMLPIRLKWHDEEGLIQFLKIRLGQC